jgi:hypothetical protein
MIEQSLWPAVEKALAKAGAMPDASLGLSLIPV